MNDFAVNFPCFSIVLSLMCAAISSALPGRWAKRLCTCAIVLVMFMSACTLVYVNEIGKSVVYIMGQVGAPWGNEIRFGVLETGLAFVFGLVMLLCINGGDSEFNRIVDPERRNMYYVMLCLMQAALLVFCYTNDTFTAYVFIEICMIASCGMLIIRRNGRTATAAMRYMIFCLMGSGLFLLGLALMYSITGHLLMPNVKEAFAALWASGEYQLPVRVIIGLIVVGLGIKCGMFPFHFWMADTYGTALTGSAGILSGIVSKGYIFLLIKFIFSVIGTEVFYASGVHIVLFVFGIAGMIIGSISAIHQNDINRMVAYSSASQIGYIFMGIGISAEAGMLAALFHILTHAITKPVLFLSSAKLSEVSGGSQKFSDLQGAGHRNKVAGIAFTVGALSMVGIPGMMGFVSKILFSYAGVYGGAKMLPTLIAIAISTVLNVLYFLRTVIRIYTPGSENTQRVRFKSQLSFAVPALIFTGINIAVGLHSQPITDLLEKGLSMLG